MVGGEGGASPTEVRPFIVIVAVVIIIIAAVTADNNNDRLFSFLFIILYPPSSSSAIELKLFKTPLNISHFLLWCLNDGS